MPHRVLLQSKIVVELCVCSRDFNPLTGTLKPKSNRRLYSNTVIGTLAVDGWAVTFGTARRALNGQCTNFILFDVTL